MSRTGSRAIVVALMVAVFATAQSPSRQISGQVRLGTQIAPAGIPVVLQVVSGKYVTPSSEPEVARTVTDSKGHFLFDNLEKIGRNSGREFFAVTGKAAGYATASQVVDLTLVSSDEVMLDLHKRDRAAADSSSAEPSSNIRRASPAAQVHIDLAQESLFRQHNPEAAINELKQAIQADPWYGQSYILLGLANMQLERWGDAQLAFSEATKVEPGNAQAYLGMGSALIEQHDYVGARKPLEESLKRNPNSAEAHYELARALYSLEKWEAAEPHARRAVELNPGYSGPHALMGNVYLQEKDLESARHEFQEYLRLDPNGGLADAARQTIAEIDKALAKTGEKQR